MMTPDLNNSICNTNIINRKFINNRVIIIQDVISSPDVLLPTSFQTTYNIVSSTRKEK